jgi:hypothetical protein
MAGPGRGPSENIEGPGIDRPAQGPSAAGEKSLGLDDVELSQEAHGDNAPDLVRPTTGRQGDGSRPFCPTHNCLMKSQFSDKVATHYKCPVPGCEGKEKRARPAVKVPADPMRCSNRSCAGLENNFLEVNVRLTSLANLHMECPNCKQGVKVPRPSFAPRLAEQRRQEPAEDFGER